MSRLFSLALATMMAFSSMTSANPLSLDARDISLEASLKFTPDTLTLDDTTGMTSFTVSLANAPNPDDVIEVQFVSPTLTFSTCKVLFNNVTYNQPITVTVWPAPTFIDSALASLDGDTSHWTNNQVGDTRTDTLPITVNMIGKYVTNSTLTYPVTRTVTPARWCRILGDPHFLTFDGATVHSAETGTHYYVNSDYLIIQGQQFRCMTTDATCISGK